MTRIIRRRTAIATAIAAGALAGPMRGWAKALPPPEPAQRLVVPFAAGGTADCLARIVAQLLNELTSSTFVIENRTGAGGNLSAEIVAKARPDGRTLLLGTVNTAVTNQFLYRNIAYDCEFELHAGGAGRRGAEHPRRASDVPRRHLRGIRPLLQRAGVRRSRYGSPGDGRHRSPDDGIPAEPGGHQAEARGRW